MKHKNRCSSLISINFRNKRGSSLAFVVILFLVISILSIAMLGMATVENNLILAEEKIDQAHYTARAVVQATSDWIGTHYNARDEMELVVPDRESLGEGNAITTSDKLNNQDYDLKIWRSATDADEIHVQATAYYQGMKSTVSMLLQETISGYALFEDAIYSKGPFGKSSGTANLVEGSVATGSDTIPDNLNVTGGRTTNKIYDFEDILPAADVVFLSKTLTADLGSGSIINNTANLNACYGTLSISDNVWIKNTDASGNPQDVHILIDDFYINEKAVLYPTDNNGGDIFIYVSNYIECSKKFGIEGNDADPCVFLICSGIGDISFDGNPCMDAYIYGPDVNVEYGGTTVLNGAVIANVYGWNGNIHVKYVKPDLDGTPFESLDEQQKKIRVDGQTWYNG